jgi:hypothetical protein
MLRMVSRITPKASWPTSPVSASTLAYLMRWPVFQRCLIAAQHVEVMWLTGRLAPDHKTIADFREDNGPAIKEGLRAIRRVVPQDGPAGEEGPRRRFPDASKS